MSRPIQWYLLLAASACLGCSSPAPRSAATDSAAFAAMQARGMTVMGVDQYTSAHFFEDLPDGGRIVLERADSTDTTDIAAIRNHMRTIAAAFARGDFALPGQVHDQVVPGTTAMAAAVARIDYHASDLPRGGQVRIVTSDTAALAAIHTFLAFQRQEHHAAGHDHHM